MINVCGKNLSSVSMLVIYGLALPLVLNSKTTTNKPASVYQSSCVHRLGHWTSCPFLPNSLTVIKNLGYDFGCHKQIIT